MGKFLETAVAMACVKSMLMVFNFVFWASGLAVLSAGIWMQMELLKYLELNAEFSRIIPYILVWTGAFILLASTLACCCTVKGHPTLLYLYGGLLGCILIVELAVATSLYAYKDRLASGFERGLNESMIKYGPDDVTRTRDFDLMQGKLQCCGNHGYQDWYNLPRSLPVPQSCCEKLHCNVQDESQIHREGCYEKVADLINENMSTILLAAIIVSVFPLIGIVLTCCLAANITKAKYEQMA